MKKYIIRVLLAVFLLTCLVLPTSIAYAEVPTHLSDVDTYAGFGVPFQHHSFIDDGRQWVFYTLNDSLVYSTSTNMVTWSAPTILHHCEDTVDIGGDWENPQDFSGTQFDLWYDSTNNKVDIVLLNTSANNSALLYARFTPNALTGALVNVTAINPWQPSLSGGGVNVSMVCPSICVTATQQPIIAVTRINASATPAIDVGVMGFANPGTGTLMALTGVWPKYNLSATGNASAFGSVIPLLSGNVSVQWVQAIGGEGYLRQAIIGITGGTDTVGTDYYVDADAEPSTPSFLWDYNAVSVHTDAVTASGNEDVFIVWNQDEGINGSSVQFNRKADTLWNGSYTATVADDDAYIGALGIRDDVGNMVYSAIGWADGTYLYSWDYDMATDVGSPVDMTEDPNGVLYAVMANYQRDLEGDENTGFIYEGDDGADTLRYAAYEQSIPPAVSDFINMTGTIVSILISFILIMLLLGIAFKEMQENGFTEMIKICITGILAIIIVETIIITFF